MEISSRYLVLIFLALTSNSAVSNVLLFDDFERPNSATVGNGWQDSVSSPPSTLSIQDGVLVNADRVGGLPTFANVYRTLILDRPLTVNASLQDGDGDASVPSGGRYDTTFTFNASPNQARSGYGIGIFRSDSTFNHSRVALIQNGVDVEAAFSTFQFGSQLDITFTLALDGSISGSIAAPNSISISCQGLSPALVLTS